eukprot:733064-Pleurochrysis_carterae.AAC.1
MHHHHDHQQQHAEVTKALCAGYSHRPRSEASDRVKHCMYHHSRNRAPGLLLHAGKSTHYSLLLLVLFIDDRAGTDSARLKIVWPASYAT